VLVDGVAVGRRVDSGLACDTRGELKLLSCPKRTAAGMPSPLQSVSTSLCEHDWFSRLLYWEALYFLTYLRTSRKSAHQRSVATSLKCVHPTVDFEAKPLDN